jgi:hypothetical protein
MEEYRKDGRRGCCRDNYTAHMMCPSDRRRPQPCLSEQVHLHEISKTMYSSVRNLRAGEPAENILLKQVIADISKG